jgi:glycosyltransferase involved in cell wall biosynthesis
MRILFLSHYFAPEGNAPATRVHGFCRRWAENGHHVTVITCAPNVPSGIVYTGYKNRLVFRESIDGIHVIRVWTFLAANEGLFRRTANYLSYMLAASIAGLLVSRPDVLVATSPQFFCGLAGALVARFRRVPFVLEIRDLWPESIVAVGALERGLAVRFLGCLEKWLYASSQHIVTVGEGYREGLLSRGVHPQSVSIIHHALDRSSIEDHESDNVLRKKWDLEGKFVCTYIGTIGIACGLGVVLKAASILCERGRKDIVFMLVGDGAMRKELQQCAGRMNLKNVIFTGRQEKAAIPAFLAASDACLVHLKKQNLFRTVFPSKILECAAAGLPIILGVEGYAADMIQKARCGICIEPDNAPQLVDAVVRLVEDPPLRRALGQSGCSYVREHFDLDDLATRYMTILQSVAGGST